jgi:hypothetical protein
LENRNWKAEIRNSKLENGSSLIQAAAVSSASSTSFTSLAFSASSARKAAQGTVIRRILQTQGRSVLSLTLGIELLPKHKFQETFWVELRSYS